MNSSHPPKALPWRSGLVFVWSWIALFCFLCVILFDFGLFYWSRPEVTLRG